tara:strand:- start:3150 stop:4991 length:1842 start_codon:yes stop_codon:yes gene_type:complete
MVSQNVVKRIPIAIGIKPDQTTTFTNKTIDGSQNVFSNIPTSALTYSSITINNNTIPLGGSINLQVEGGEAIINTDTTYSIKASTVATGASLDLDAGGSGVGTDSVTIEGGGNVTVTRIDGNTIRISDSGTLGGVALTSTSTATLTNKTIDGLENTLLNIQNAQLANSSITINGDVIPLGGSATIAGGGGGGSGDVTLNGIQTLTNKTISGNLNTLTNIGNSSLTNSEVYINGQTLALGGSLTVSGLGDVTTTGTQDLSNKSLLAPAIQDAVMVGTLSAGNTTGIAGQVLKSTATGIEWDYENQTTGADLTIGAGLTGTGGTTFNGSNGVTISVNTSIVATLDATQTLTNKTLTAPNLTGDLKVGGVSGQTGQVIVSDGAGGLSWGAGGAGGGGSFNGPSTSTDNAIARYDGTTGALAQNSLVTIADDGAITAPAVANVIPFYYASQLTFPNASTYHGAIAHSHQDEAMYFAHGGNWVRLANQSDVQVSSRQSFTQTTGSLANNASAYPTFVAYKSYLILKVETDKAAWVRFYTTTAARNADVNRPIDEDPAPGSGVLAEIVTTGAQTQLLTPATIGFNDDSPVATNVYMSVTNRSGTTGTVTVTVDLLKLES